MPLKTREDWKKKRTVWICCFLIGCLSLSESMGVLIDWSILMAHQGVKGYLSLKVSELRLMYGRIYNFV